MEFIGNTREDFLFDGGILYRRVDKLYPFRRRAIDAGEALISLFRSTRKTQSIPAKTKLSQH